MKESPIFTKAFDMLAWLLPATLKFPREHRFVLAQRTQNAAFNFYETITAASLSKQGMPIFTNSNTLSSNYYLPNALHKPHQLLHALCGIISLPF